VLDVDLVGLYPWWKFPFDTRVLRSSSAPTIEVRCIYSANRKKIEESKERIADMNYLHDARTARPGEFLYYEKKCWVVGSATVLRIKNLRQNANSLQRDL
jgi:hypothetical protein